MKAITEWIGKGLLKRKFHIVNGLDAAPSALPLLYSGGNTGKLYVAFPRLQNFFFYPNSSLGSSRFLSTGSRPSFELCNRLHAVICLLVSAAPVVVLLSLHMVFACQFYLCLAPLVFGSHEYHIFNPIIPSIGHRSLRILQRSRREDSNDKVNRHHQIFPLISGHLHQSLLCTGNEDKLVQLCQGLQETHVEFEYEKVFEDQPLSPAAELAQRTKALMEAIQTKMEGIKVQMRYLPYWLLSSHLRRTISLSSTTQEKHAGPNLAPTRGFTISPNLETLTMASKYAGGDSFTSSSWMYKYLQCCRTWFRETCAVNICLLISRPTVA